MNEGECNWGCMVAGAFSFPEEKQEVPQEGDATHLESMALSSIVVQSLSGRSGGVVPLT